VSARVSVRKVIAMLICLTFMPVLCSCKNDATRDLVFRMTKMNADSIVGRSLYIPDNDSEIYSYMRSITSESYLPDDQARAVIADTLTYDIIEESFEGGVTKTQQKVDVVFEYVNYHKLMDGIHEYQDIEEFKAAVESCSDRISKTITFEYDYEDYDCKWIYDARSIEGLFPYYDAHFVHIDYGEYLSDPVFSADGYDPESNDIYDVTGMACVFQIDPEAYNLEWYYSVEVLKDGERIAYNSYFDNPHPSAVIGYFSTTKTLGMPEGTEVEDGTYEFIIYDQDNNVIATATCTVTDTVAVRHL